MLEEELVFPSELKLTASTIQKIPTNRLSEVVALLIQETISKATQDKKCLTSHSASEKSTSETDVTCEKKGTGDNCKDGCKWGSDGPNKKCVVDKTYTPKQVDGGEKKLIKCSDATTEEECKKVEGKKPEGKNAVCGWIDYVDGRGKLPKHECLDGCFIGGKQFALMAAAFMALLF
uniref:Variant surface glycoprotein n=1 Tax=Trypanosoma brucei TaxID=5691 RepID=A0A1V0FYA8_9TRYP|nr:variant surface glycoprotein [Trypanosoma brucei]